jgi:hypothetical protein
VLDLHLDEINIKTIISQILIDSNTGTVQMVIVDWHGRNRIALCCRLQFGDGTIAIVLFGWYYSDGNSRFAIGMMEIAHCCRLQLMMVQ